MATRRAMIEQVGTFGDYRIRITERGSDDIIESATTLINAVTLAGNNGASAIIVASPGVEEYPYSAGYAVGGRHASFATAEQAIAYARECKRISPATPVSAYRETDAGGIHYLDIATGSEFPRGERHRF